MYENSYKRGTVHFVRMDRGMGSEEGAFRPGVIVSTDGVNPTNPTVVVAYMTSQPKDNGLYFDTMATGKRSWVLSNQLATVDKRRLGKVLGELDGYELGLLDDALLETLGIDEPDDSSQNLIEDLTRQLDEEKAAHDAQIESYKVEIAMWQRLYEKALGTLVDMKFTKDLIHREVNKAPAPVEPVVEPVVEAPVVEPEEPPEPVDVNTATLTQLKKVGFTATIGRLIIGCRPYRDASEVQYVPGMKMSQYEKAKELLYCTPAEPVVEAPAAEPVAAKVNVNVVTKEELVGILGFSKETAREVVCYRKKHGPYSSIDELLNVPRFGKGCLKKYGSMLEV